MKKTISLFISLFGISCGAATAHMPLFNGLLQGDLDCNGANITNASTNFSAFFVGDGHLLTGISGGSGVTSNGFQTNLTAVGADNRDAFVIKGTPTNNSLIVTNNDSGSSIFAIDSAGTVGVYLLGLDLSSPEWSIGAGGAMNLGEGNTILRDDGSGYLSEGAISWDTSGNFQAGSLNAGQGDVYLGSNENYIRNEAITVAFPTLWVDGYQTNNLALQWWTYSGAHVAEVSTGGVFNVTGLTVTNSASIPTNTAAFSPANTTKLSLNTVYSISGARTAFSWGFTLTDTTGASKLILLINGNTNDLQTLSLVGSESRSFQFEAGDGDSVTVTNLSAVGGSATSDWTTCRKK